ARRPGWLARGPYIWDRVMRGRDGREVYAHVIEGDGIEGYAVHGQKPTGAAAMGYEMALRDLIAVTPRAARRLLAFLGDHRTLAGDAVWTGGVDDPFLHMLGEQHG